MARFGLTILLFTSVCAFAGNSACGPQNQKWTVEAKAAPDFKAPVDADHATVVFLHDSIAGVGHTDKIGIDGQWKAATKRGTFAAFQAEPGEHVVCAAGLTYRLNAKPGQIYYLGAIQPAMFSLIHLTVLQEDNALNQMARMKLAISQPKN